MESGVCAPVCQVCSAALLGTWGLFGPQNPRGGPQVYSPWLTPHPLMECRGPSDLWTPCFNPGIEHNLDEMREWGKGWGRPGSHPRATSGEGPSSGIPEYDPVIRFMTWPSSFGHPQLAPATWSQSPASGGLGRESPSYTGKSRHRRQEQSPASA